MSEYKIVDTDIVNWGSAILQKTGLSKTDALTIANALATTSLWGIDSHGIARIPHYLQRISTGSINVEPKIDFKKTGLATGQVDGDNGHGIVIMHKATNHAIELAKEAGTGIVGVINSSHCGAIGLYTRKITQAGMVGIAFTHSDALVVPHNGRKAFFGTNPISIAFPTLNAAEPICLDMATSIIPWNYIMNAKRERAKVPMGYGVDAAGDDSEIAADVVAVKPMAGHKGYALAFLIDMLCGPLNGMQYGPNITPMYQELDKARGLGSLVIAIDPDKFGGKDYVMAIGSQMIDTVKQYGDDILFPGQPEYASKKMRSDNGIPVTEALANEYKEWSERLDTSLPVYK